ncbi:MAG: aminoacyl-histidine dipeptidase [Defluviitaleaceae bacterium]|nr:aminoacyl-histidine dipeptidase [Defluviitaleaceae bacterium]
MAVLTNCKPTNVFKYFEEICTIPHGSWNEKALSDHIYNWARGLGLDTIQDELFNLIIRKPATPGHEAAPTVIIQGHLDMVCEKNNDVDFDFTTQGLDIYVDGDYIKARGTTLGADNGIAVAMAMALLADKTLAHPAIEVVLTTVEEAGMDGAKAIDPTNLSGTRLINVDSENEGVFLSSCAGGARVRIALEITRQPLPAVDFVAYNISIGGLKGGHSGMDIAKERGNANKILGRVLNEIAAPYHLANIGGGSKDNAIPREAWATICAPSNAKQEIEALAATLAKEFEHGDGGLFVRIEETTKPQEVFSPTSQKQAIGLLLTLPSGVAHMSAALAGLVETSNNLGVVSIDDNVITYTCAVRSSVESRKYALIRQISAAAEAFGATAVPSDGYPGWAYSPNSELRDIFTTVYKAKYGKDAEILAIHAGLECGVFADKLPGLDMISFGPNMHDVHTPDERLSISSTANCYEFLKDVLAAMK